MNSPGKFIFPYWCEVIFYEQAEPTLTADLVLAYPVHTRIVYNFDVFSLVDCLSTKHPASALFFKKVPSLVAKNTHPNVTTLIKH